MKLCLPNSALSLLFPALLCCTCLSTASRAQGEPEKSQKTAQDPTKKPAEKSAGKPEEKRAELPKLPPNKRDALSELLRKFGKDDKTDLEKKPRETGGFDLRDVPNAKKQDGSTPKTGDAKSAPATELDRIAEIVRKAREKRIAAGGETKAVLPPNPFIGTWAVTQIVRERMFGPVGGSGWIIFTPSYMSMHLFAGGTAGGDPRWQTAMRRYWVQGPSFVTSTIMGLQSAVDGNALVIEESGRRESRRYQFLGADSLRIIQGSNRYIDLRRVERF